MVQREHPIPHLHHIFVGFVLSILPDSSADLQCIVADRRQNRCTTLSASGKCEALERKLSSHTEWVLTHVLPATQRCDERFLPIKQIRTESESATVRMQSKASYRRRNLTQCLPFPAAKHQNQRYQQFTNGSNKPMMCFHRRWKEGCVSGALRQRMTVAQARTHNICVNQKLHNNERKKRRSSFFFSLRLLGLSTPKVPKVCDNQS
jgi:hypothetical protein